MFRLIGYGENIGSGFPKILHAWKQVGWKEPKLENKLALEEVVLTLYVPEVIEGEDGQRTTQKTTQKTTQETTQRTTQRTIAEGLQTGQEKGQETTQKRTVKITSVQKLILEHIQQNPQTTRAEIAGKLTDITEDGVKYNLKVLQQKGLLKRVGPDKGGYWEIISE